MKILWLSHFVPWPPHGGMRQRSWNLLRAAAEGHEIDLVALNQRALLPTAAAVEGARKELEAVCREVRVFSIPAERGTWRWPLMAARSALRSTPYHQNWLHSPELRRWLAREGAGRRYDLVHADTVGLAPLAARIPAAARVLNHHNVESHMLARRAAGARNPAARLYMEREAAKLARLEARASRAAVNLVVSDDDAARLRAVAPGARIRVVENGVDVDFFRSRRAPGAGREGVVFTGQLSWYANREAVRFLLFDVWPALAADHVPRRLTLAGRDPPPEALEAARRDARIVVTGEVDDMRPWFEDSAVYACPIRDGGGTRLKVLDALAMAKPLVATDLAVEGLGLVEGEHFVRAETPADFVGWIRRLEADDALRARLARAGRAFVEARYSWRIVGEHLRAAYGFAAGEVATAPV